LLINMLRFFSFILARYLPDNLKCLHLHMVYDANFKPTFEQRKTGA